MARKSKQEEILSFKTESQLGDIEQMKRSIDDLGSAVDDLGKDLNEVESDAKAAEGKLSKLGDIGAITTGVKSGAEVVGGAVGGVVGLIGGVFETERALKLVSAQTGLTGPDLEDFEEQARDVFENNWGDSLMDVFEAMSQVRRMTGLSGDELERVTTDAIAMRDIFGTDVTESVRAAGTMAEQFGISSDAAFDLLFAGMQQTGDPMDDLLDTMNEYSDNFVQMGLTAPQAMGLLKQGLDAGAVSTDALADALLEFQIRLTNGESHEAVRGLSEHTSELLDLWKDGKVDMETVLSSVMTDLRNIEDPIERNQLGVELFGTKWEEMGGKALLALDPATAGLENVEGAADRAQEVIGEGLTGTLDQAKRDIEAGFRDMGAALKEGDLEGAIRGIGDSLTSIPMNIARNFASEFLDIDLDSALSAWHEIPGQIGEIFDLLEDKFEEATGIDLGGLLTSILEFNLDDIVITDEEISDFINGVFESIQNTITEFMSGGEEGESIFGEAVANFGPSLFAAFGLSLPDPIQWVFDNIINPIIDVLPQLGVLAAQAINEAIPNDIKFEIPSVATPFGPIGGGQITIDLPDDPVPVPQFATGGSFVVPGSGTSDQVMTMVGLTPGEIMTVTPRGQTPSGGSDEMILHNVLQIDREVLFERTERVRRERQ